MSPLPWACRRRGLPARINRELSGNFALRQFAHLARYDERRRRIEMHLVSTRRQTVSIPGAGITATFDKAESIWTEACHKSLLEELEGIAHRCGFRSQAQWVDPQWPFAESLWIAG